MSIQIISKENQAYGAFNGGEIIENKPIGFPQDGGRQRPYSNLFYWAHAKAVVDSTIGLHPHQGFEICSFVLKGPLRHFDTKQKEWLPLDSGDVQIIRAGNGISHSEFMGKDSEMFQIWFDPNLARTLEKPASYSDYRSADFPVEEKEGVRIQHLIGGGSQFHMDTPGVHVQRISLKGGALQLNAGASDTCSLYVVGGGIRINGQEALVSDFVVIQGEIQVELIAQESADVFVILSPTEPGYRTYGQLRG